MSSRQPIGLFDSGAGGISVWKEIAKQLPYEDTVYVSDNANYPYGNKPAEEIIRLSDRVARFLLEKRCKIIVVACNTATAGAIDYLRKAHASVSFVGMEPAVKPAVLSSKTGVVGILATAGTFKGRLFNETKERFASSVKIIEQVGEGLVEAVENRTENSDETKQLLRSYIQPMLDKGIDHLVLGCTHYPFLTTQIQEITGDRITILDPAPAVAKQVKHLLEEKRLQSDGQITPTHHFYTTGNPTTVRTILASLQVKNYTVEEVAIL